MFCADDADANANADATKCRFARIIVSRRICSPIRNEELIFRRGKIQIYSKGTNKRDLLHFGYLLFLYFLYISLISILTCTRYSCFTLFDGIIDEEIDRIIGNRWIYGSIKLECNRVTTETSTYLSNTYFVQKCTLLGGVGSLTLLAAMLNLCRELMRAIISYYMPAPSPTVSLVVPVISRNPISKDDL